MRKPFFVLIQLLFFPTWAIAQSTSNQLSYDDYIFQVLDGHPMALAAQLQSAKGDAVLLQARGAFDPKVDGQLQQKNFEGKQYYSLGQAQLKVPTWFGVEAEAGYGATDGVFLNPQNNLPEAGLWYAGLTVPLGEGLIRDQRRTALHQAKVAQRMSEVEGRQMLNSLVFEASMAYYSWALAERLRNIYTEAASLAEERLSVVKSNATLGEIPMIDTLEASIQTQNRRLALQQAELDWQNARLGVSNYLWIDGKTPLELEDRTVSQINLLDQLSVGSTVLWNDSLIRNQPQVMQAMLKVENLELSQQLKREQLKPTVDLKYRPITSAANNEFGLQPTNYTWGLSVSMPLFLRKERGALQLANIKLQEEKLGLTQKNRTVEIKLQSALQVWNNSRDQALLYRQIVNDYRSLLEGEVRKFEVGESSLFLINAREIKYIEAQTKEAELSVKNLVARLKFDFVLGKLGQ